MTKYTYITLSNAADDRHDEFNEWYTNVHIVDVVNQVPGVVSAQRFQLAPVQRREPPHPWRYLAIYQIDTEDLQATMRSLQELSGSPAMPVSDSFDPKHLALVFEAISPAVRNPAVADLTAE